MTLKKIPVQKELDRQDRQQKKLSVKNLKIQAEEEMKAAEKRRKGTLRAVSTGEDIEDPSGLTQDQLRSWSINRQDRMSR